MPACSVHCYRVLCSAVLLLCCSLDTSWKHIPFVDTEVILSERLHPAVLIRESCMPKTAMKSSSNLSAATLPCMLHCAFISQPHRPSGQLPLGEMFNLTSLSWVFEGSGEEEGGVW